MYSRQTRKMEDICNILHQVRRSNGGNVMYYGDLDDLINTAEQIHEDMKVEDRDNAGL